jgi:hypothetical protein
MPQLVCIITAMMDCLCGLHTADHEPGLLHCRYHPHGFQATTNLTDHQSLCWLCSFLGTWLDSSWIRHPLVWLCHGPSNTESMNCHSPCHKQYPFLNWRNQKDSHWQHHTADLAHDDNSSIPLEFFEFFDYKFASRKIKMDITSDP